VILTVTLNAALDVTYDVDLLVPGATHRVRSARQRAGGKGVNVASVLTMLGVPVTATGLLGGGTGDEIAADLDARGIQHSFFRCSGESRRTVNVVSMGDGEATIFNEPGPELPAAEWSALLGGMPELIVGSRAAVMVLSGSLPPGAPEDAYAQLVLLAQHRGVQTVVDADGAVLRQAVAAHPDVIKPNVFELKAATGEHEVLPGAEILRRHGALDVVVSAGERGAVVVTRDGRHLTARMRTRLSGNPTGAGDAMVAAVAAGLAGGAAGPDWSRTIVQAVAWSAAAVLSPLAGDIDHGDVARLAADVELEEKT
jgi:tagatose 6-phosphate kinase